MSGKDPRFVESGRRGARKRWAQADPSTRTSVRLDELTPDQRAVVLALVEAEKSKNTAAA
jgi:hypothetical protein